MFLLFNDVIRPSSNIISMETSHIHCSEPYGLRVSRFPSCHANIYRLSGRNQRLKLAKTEAASSIASYRDKKERRFNQAETLAVCFNYF